MHGGGWRGRAAGFARGATALRSSRSAAVVLGVLMVLAFSLVGCDLRLLLIHGPRFTRYEVAGLAWLAEACSPCDAAWSSSFA